MSVVWEVSRKKGLLPEFGRKFLYTRFVKREGKLQ